MASASPCCDECSIRQPPDSINTDFASLSHSEQTAPRFFGLARFAWKRRIIMAVQSFTPLLEGSMLPGKMTVFCHPLLHSHK
jgi:hypothetical protein